MKVFYAQNYWVSESCTLSVIPNRTNNFRKWIRFQPQLKRWKATHSLWSITQASLNDWSGVGPHTLLLDASPPFHLQREGFQASKIMSSVRNSKS